MKLWFTSLILSLFSVCAIAQSYNSPESVEYDAAHQRYIVANTSANNLQQVIPGSNPTLFVSSVPSPYGIAIVGDTVYVCCNSTHLRGYSLSTGTQAFDVNLGGTFLNGICTDYKGNIFVTDFSAKKIVRYNIASQQFNYFVGTAMAKTPNGIVYDAFHNRLVIATWNPNATILGLNLSDSSITTLKSTTLSQIDGISIDEDGNFYSADWSSNSVYFYDSAFANSPIQIVSGLSRPADISYTILTDTLAVPNTLNNTVMFFGFPRPVPVSDYYNATVGIGATICVLQNDLISGNGPLTLQSFSGNNLGTATASNNCINYTPSAVGNDTITYVVCSVDTPSFCRSGTLYITNASGSNNLPPDANNDTASTTQGTYISVDVVANDSDPNNDSLCITGVSGSFGFGVNSNDCHKIDYTPDSSFTGNDTCYYWVCDNGNPVLCDSGMLVVTVNACTLNDFGLGVFCADDTPISTDGCPWCLKLVAMGAPNASVQWHIMEYWNSIPDTTLIGTDTLIMSLPSGSGCPNAQLVVPYHANWIVCATLQGACGSITHCDTVLINWESINDLDVANAKIYPIPASTTVTIDMSSSPITERYAIDILNSNGTTVKTIAKNNKVCVLDVSDLSPGIYLATLRINRNERQLIGRFTIQR
ncbi:MAG: Ig-like domain-containing protein [Chitinophagales bacterium]